jgi:predicted permease
MFQLSVLEKIVPFYILIALGALALKRFKTDKDSISTLLIYFFAPVIVFTGVAQASPTSSTLLLPVLFFTISCLVCLVTFRFSKSVWPNSTEPNILAMASGSGNTGYFGIPITTALFGNEILPTVVLCILGVTLFENSLGYYLVARSKNSKQEALRRLLKLPTLYAFLIGLIFCF